MGIFNKEEKTPSRTVVEDVCKIKKGEKVLIIANPETNLIAQSLYTASKDCGALPVLMFQSVKTSMDYAEDAVIGALKSEPDVVFSISAVKLGKDREAVAKPYKTEDGKSFDSIFDYLLDGKKTIRAVWTPGLTNDMFERTVNIDYKLLGDRCKKICQKYEDAVSVHVTSPNGTDVTVPVEGRKGLLDNGDFSKGGSGGNIPAGEVFISPVVGSGNQELIENAAKLNNVVKALIDAKDKIVESKGKDTAEAVQEVAETITSKEEKTEEIIKGCEGTIVFDGSMSFSDGDSLLEKPITVKVVHGFVTDISGGDEAKRLLKDISNAEKESVALEAAGKLEKGMGIVYSRNARNIGELGIGLNPNANITGNMLEDEKAFRTCHFAIGANYDGDAPSLIHFDGVVRNPTIVIKYKDQSEFKLLDAGELKI